MYLGIEFVLNMIWLLLESPIFIRNTNKNLKPSDYRAVDLQAIGKYGGVI